MRELIFGVGISDSGSYPRSVDRKMTKEYVLWKSMLDRCYSTKYQNIRPTYVGCSVSEEFKYFQKFAEWCQEQVGFGVKGHQLDKDIIYKGNKQYNADACAFIPTQINNLLLDSVATRGNFPVGVCFHKSKGCFQSRINKNGKSYHLGYFATDTEARLVYISAKEEHVKLMAEEYKNSIDIRVYDALMKWRVLDTTLGSNV